MTIKVGINGMGRIGRMIVRSIIENNNKSIKIKHINNIINLRNRSVGSAENTPTFYRYIYLIEILNNKCIVALHCCLHVELQ